MTPTTSAFQRGMTPSTSDALQRGFRPTYIRHSQRSPIDPIYQAQTNPLTYQAQQSSPARQKPDFGLKPGGVLPPPPNDLVMTTRLRRKYYKDGQLQISPTISSVYLHVNSYCALAAQPDFTLASCHLPNDLVPFLQTEHYNLIYAKLGLNFAQNL